jgi:hypothetical protein
MSIKRNKQHNPNKKLRKYAKGDKRYIDFVEDGAVNADKLRWCKSCEQWIPPPGIHTCHDAKAEREARVAELKQLPINSPYQKR